MSETTPFSEVTPETTEPSQPESEFANNEETAKLVEEFTDYLRGGVPYQEVENP